VNASKPLHSGQTTRSDTAHAASRPSTLAATGSCFVLPSRHTTTDIRQVTLAGNLKGFFGSLLGAEKLAASWINRGIALAQRGRHKEAD
jgi:hypothetical protein